MYLEITNMKILWQHGYVWCLGLGIEGRGEWRQVNKGIHGGNIWHLGMGVERNSEVSLLGISGRSGLGVSLRAFFCCGLWKYEYSGGLDGWSCVLSGLLSEETGLDEFTFLVSVCGECINTVGMMILLRQNKKDKSQGEKYHTRVIYSESVKISKWTHIMWHLVRVSMQ